MDLHSVQVCYLQLAIYTVVINILKGSVQDRSFACVHAIKTNIWLFGTMNPKQFRSVQLSKIKRISIIVMLIVVIDSI